MFPVGFPVFITCGAPHAEWTLAQPSKTPAVCAPMEFKPLNPQFCGRKRVSYIRLREWVGGGGLCQFMERGIWYFYGPHVGMFLDLWYPNGPVFISILVSVWVQIFGLVGTPLPTFFEEDPPPPPPPPPPGTLFLFRNMMKSLHGMELSIMWGIIWSPLLQYFLDKGSVMRNLYVSFVARLNKLLNQCTDAHATSM